MEETFGISLSTIDFKKSNSFFVSVFQKLFPTLNNPDNHTVTLTCISFFLSDNFFNFNMKHNLIIQTKLEK